MITGGSDAAGGGTPAALVGVWNGLKVQDPLNADSDYFDDSSLDAKWTEWDVSSLVTLTEDSDGLSVSRITGGSGDMNGLYQAAPSGDYVVTLHVRLQATLSDFTGFALLVADDLAANPSTANFAVVSLVHRSSTVAIECATQRWNAYNNFGAALSSSFNVGVGFTELYLRIAVDNTGSNLTTLISTNGRDWTQLWTGTFAAASITAADSIGICVNNQQSGTVVLRSNMFRVDASSDPYLSVGGAA